MCPQERISHRSITRPLTMPYVRELSDDTLLIQKRMSWICTARSTKATSEVLCSRTLPNIKAYLSLMILNRGMSASQVSSEKTRVRLSLLDSFQDQWRYQTQSRSLMTLTTSSRLATFRSRTKGSWLNRMLGYKDLNIGIALCQLCPKMAGLRHNNILSLKHTKESNLLGSHLGNNWKTISLQRPSSDTIWTKI